MEIPDHYAPLSLASSFMSGFGGVPDNFGLRKFFRLTAAHSVHHGHSGLGCHRNAAAVHCHRE